MAVAIADLWSPLIDYHGPTMKRSACCPVLVLFAVIATGCASFHTRPMEEVPFIERAQTQTVNDITVTVAVPTEAETRELFDAKLDKKRIQPVWLEIENGTDEMAWFFHYSLDPDYFPPLEVAWKSHRTWAKKTNERIDRFFHDQQIGAVLRPHERSSGFVFVNLDRGWKYVPVEILQEDGLHEFEFFSKVPGFKADYEIVDFDNLYSPEELIELQTEAELRAWVEGLPCCTENKNGTKTGDPLNFVLIGTEQALNHALVRARWDVTRAMSTGSAMATAGAAVFGKTYRYAPISSLYVMGRPQDSGLQKARWNIHQRNHMRLWVAPATYRDEYIFIGQISRDIGSRLTTKSSTLTTHKIDPAVDEARNYLILDMIYAHAVSAYGFTWGVERSTWENPGRNLTGDPYFTDGRRAVIFLSEDSVSYEETNYLEWITPEDLE